MVMPFGGLLSDLQAQPTGLAAEVAAKALTTSERIGGTDGFGGVYLGDYMGHMDRHMGFHGADSLADPEGRVFMRFDNESGENSVFRVVYMASHLGLDEQTLEVAVDAASSVTVELPCAEIVGLGSLTEVGDVAALLGDGVSLDNRWCVPAFLGSDFACGTEYVCHLGADIDDLDGDGDTDELLVTTDALTLHMRPGGFFGHGGMMGMWPLRR